MGVPALYRGPYFYDPDRDPFQGEEDPEWVVLRGFDNSAIESQHDVHLAMPVEVDEDAAADGAVEAGPKALQHSHGLLPLASRPQTLNATGGDLIDSADSASDAVAECEVEISPSHVDWLCLMKKFTVVMGVSVDKLADDLDPGMFEFVSPQQCRAILRGSEGDDSDKAQSHRSKSSAEATGGSDNGITNLESPDSLLQQERAQIVSQSDVGSQLQQVCRRRCPGGRQVLPWTTAALVGFNV